ncbi:hypothetical protein WUBG_10435 [Wuchereria bancrofti]|uniref:Uncharacterized protein n=1 Tax=Wuchereria bancrofti TaxID=6293 RepID=J9E8M9_WUCBA|nr:hypothetical protein WUBG_10435 [Wuchereria bancrofti]
MSNALLILAPLGNYPLMSSQSDSKTQSVILTEDRRGSVLAHSLRASLPFPSLRSASEQKSDYNKSARNDDDDGDDNGDDDDGDDDVGDEIIEAITITAQQLF